MSTKTRVVKEGSIIRVPESKKLLRELGDRVPAMELAMQDMALAKLHAHERFWEEVTRTYPELEKWLTSYSYKEHTLTVLREKRPEEC